MPEGPAAARPPRHRYGVVVCPKCRHAHGLELKSRSATCGRCGGRNATRRLQVLYGTDDPERLREAVGVVEARVTGGEAALVNLEALKDQIEARARTRASPDPPAGHSDEQTLVQWAASRAAAEQGTRSRVARIMSALEQAQEEGFTQEQLEAAFEAAGLPAERALKEIKAGLVRDELYEPRPGRLKRL